jgi:serine protease Do
MCSKRVKPLFILSAIILISCIACGGGTPAATQPAATPTTAPAEPTETSAPTATAVPTGLVTQLSDLKKATIQIEAQGTFIDPQFGYMANQAGLGSGFIIDPSGIAITNNHVVTGAALLKVWVGGDTSKTYNAKILGVSECSDLAVIDIEGDGFPYLEWHDGTANVGLEVYAAGYPLGDPEFTMTKGIISKEKASGETGWASVDSVIEHTSTINPGNSGGPLVDADAKVVGVNYAGVSSTNQYYAIDRGTALPVIDQLKGGKDVDSIGINGEAVASDDGSITGVWVSSIKSGSTADKAGIKAGDILLTMENLSLAMDGTMNDYCDILRTHNPGDTLAIEVLRWQTQELLDGQLNGRTLEVSYSPTEPTQEPAVAEPTTTTGGGNLPANCESSDTSGFISCWDETGYIMMDVPDYWTDVNGSSWTFGDNNDVIGVALSAAPNLSDFSNYYDSEGVFFGASDTFAQIGGYVEFLDYYKTFYDGDCTWVGRYDYNDGVYRGKYDVFNNCAGPSDYETYVLSAVDIVDPTSKIILVEATIYYTDTWILDQIWGTFYVYF